MAFTYNGICLWSSYRHTIQIGGGRVMKDRIAKVIFEQLCRDGISFVLPDTIDCMAYCKKLAEPCLELISKEYIPIDQDIIKLFKAWVLKRLPKDGDDDFEIMAHEYYKQGFGDCLKDIKHKLEVE